MFQTKQYRSARLKLVPIWLGELCQVPFKVNPLEKDDARPSDRSRTIGCEDLNEDMAEERKSLLGVDGDDCTYVYPYSLAIHPNYG